MINSLRVGELGKLGGTSNVFFNTTDLGTMWMHAYMWVRWRAGLGLKLRIRFLRMHNTRVTLLRKIPLYEKR